MSETTTREAFAQAIYKRSVAEADNSGLPDWLEDHDGGMWLPADTRGQAIAYYAAEYGHAFTEVRAQRQYMRIDHDAIRDLAEDMARDDGYESDDEPVAYTWEGEGWLWERCGKGDERGVALWYCELRPEVPDA